MKKVFEEPTMELALIEDSVANELETPTSADVGEL